MHLVRRSLVLRIVAARQAEVRRHERSIAGDLAREADRGAVGVAHPVRVPDRREFLLARVEGEGLQALRARVEELLMELFPRGRMLEDAFRREGPRLDVASFPELEQVTAITEHDALLQLLEDALVPGILTPASPTLGHLRRKGDRSL